MTETVNIVGGYIADIWMKRLFILYHTQTRDICGFYLSNEGEELGASAEEANLNIYGRAPSARDSKAPFSFNGRYFKAH